MGWKHRQVGHLNMTKLRVQAEEIKNNFACRLTLLATACLQGRVWGSSACRVQDRDECCRRWERTEVAEQGAGAADADLRVGGWAAEGADAGESPTQTASHHLGSLLSLCSLTRSRSLLDHCTQPQLNLLLIVVIKYLTGLSRALKCVESTAIKLKMWLDDKLQSSDRSQLKQNSKFSKIISNDE